MNKTITLTRKQAAKIISLSYPDYKGRKITVEFSDTVSFYDTNWGGGSKNYYTALGLTENGELVARQYIAPAPWNNTVEGTTVALPTNALIVERSFFCGKETGLTIYVNPAQESLFNTQATLALS